ncbi:CSLREA domain-containing protein [Iningainema tapete]|uniref:Right handed beta helix domain-containing protein n=1 Tax=Iningainema tapete BLCC-T55 TaxID=2748662 RepID=A0A8J6XD86_9CYAN|nr:CSLREA domain-containing protein [Iningainema tapete]MBD2773765.1 hypothetical protein [Iningainema tapete BLCC-T55]
MVIPGSTTDYQLTPIAFSTPVFSDNVQDLLGVGILSQNLNAIITVNSTADVLDDSDGVTSLREAIISANADDGEDTIVFERALFSTVETITLTGGELDITDNLSIIAPRDTLTGGDLVTISGNNTSRVFEIEEEATVRLNGLIIADGRVGDNGDGIRNSSTLILDNSIIRDSSAISIDDRGIINNPNGGGIFKTGRLSVNNSTISSNRTTNGTGTGGISNTGGTISVNHSTISGNSSEFGGGGISNSSGISVNHSTISGNLSEFGGGISNSSGISVNHSTISGNSSLSSRFDSGGGISNRGKFLLNNSNVSGNSVTGNFGSGGGIFNGSIRSDTPNITIINSTISGNSAPENGGGIFNDYNGTVTLLFSTLTQNQAANGGGVYSRTGSNSVQNPIIASNLNSDNGVNPDVSDTFTSNG